MDKLILKKALILNAEEYADALADEGEVTFDNASGTDYDVIAMYCVNTDKVIFIGDSWHDTLEDFLEGFFLGLDTVGVEYELEEMVLNIGDNTPDENDVVLNAFREAVN